MKKYPFAAIAVFAALGLSAGAFVPHQAPSMSASYQKWLDEDVSYIITALEREVFLKLQTDRQRDLFIQAFWNHRNPNPTGMENAFKTEHYRRINYANQRYGRSAPMPGWKTDRGRVYIILGEPNDVQKLDNKIGLFPIEIWFYQGKEKLGLPTGFYVLFYQRGSTGDFRLYSPSRDGPQALMSAYHGDPIDYQAAYQALSDIEPTVADVSMSLIPTESSSTVGRPSQVSDLLLRKIEDSGHSQVEEAYARKFFEYKDIVEVEYSANYLDCDSLLKVSRESPGMYFVHYAVEPKRLSLQPSAGAYAAILKVNGTVATPEGKTVYQFEKPISLTLDENRMKTANAQPLNLLDMFPLVAGTYKVSVLMKNEVSKEFMSFEQSLVIPGETPVLQMTSPILGFKNVRGETPSNTLKPFQIGPFDVSTQPMRIFSRKETLSVVFQVFGLSEAQKRSGRLRFLFTKDAKPVLDRTRPLAECPDLPAVLAEFPLADFLPAHYVLKVALLGDDRELVAGTEEFDVSFREALPRPWYYTKRMPGPTDSIYDVMLGSQLFNLGRLVEARGFIERARQRMPGNEAAALWLARIDLALDRPGQVFPVLSPFLNAPHAPKYEIFFLAGQSLLKTGDFAGALGVLQQAESRFGINTGLLNAIGDCYIGLGRPRDARAVWDKSLEINRDQPQIKKKRDAVKDAR